MIKVKIQLYAWLEKFTPAGEKIFEIELQLNSTVLDLIAKLNLPAEKVTLIIINGTQQKKKAILRDGDEVKLFPLIAGG
ncbi:MoaD/ThiS family protein [Desulfosporosinus sp.]|uniref:MoaD/ThiS family protein n=1 Tax=Desulfosporosinus sp. TaxID=157907 RepID=UPI0025BC6B23|nr:MoaD/ThiS family protein [Desulfosporosinus sp.]MBC2722478.1 MoaD/ThiS family protein [Desulfosporosinus sp.]MBC2727075.1 MoaD/ThiS family protein [Desulfosporosinus sp.]